MPLNHDRIHPGTRPPDILEANLFILTKPPAHLFLPHDVQRKAVGGRPVRLQAPITMIVITVYCHCPLGNPPIRAEDPQALSSGNKFSQSSQ